MYTPHNDSENNLESENKKLKELVEQLDSFVKNQEELSVEKMYYEYASTLLKDTGIKTKIVKQYLPIMNKLINKYLSSMDFFVNFNINENFEEHRFEIRDYEKELNHIYENLNPIAQKTWINEYHQNVFKIMADYEQVNGYENYFLNPLFSKNLGMVSKTLLFRLISSKASFSIS